MSAEAKKFGFPKAEIGGLFLGASYLLFLGVGDFFFYTQPSIRGIELTTCTTYPPRVIKDAWKTIGDYRASLGPEGSGLG